MHYSGIFSVVITILLASKQSSSANCGTEFKGFGVHLGSIGHFNRTNNETIQNVLDHMYHDLKIRHFRTSYEPYFSPSAGIYDLTCHYSNCTWAWESILEILSNKTRYPEPTLMASVWSPPFYMKNTTLSTLKSEYEWDYYLYIKNVTQLIYQKFNLTVERVSPVNEPENAFATWDHCVMGPDQLCRMFANFNDTLVSLCPENAYFWTTQIYMTYSDLVTKCINSCRTVATHAYRLNVDVFSENFGKTAYDLHTYHNTFGNKPIWMTEVSSTYSGAENNQMDEGLDLALNIVNFLGTTCVERYYYWSAFTVGASGESLIWGENGQLRFPKKYFIYNHFTNASSSSAANGPVHISPCASSGSSVQCVHFDNQTTVFVNTKTSVVPLQNCTCDLCCTTAAADIFCSVNGQQLPAKSVCTCNGPCDWSGSAGNINRSHGWSLLLLVFGYLLF